MSNDEYLITEKPLKALFVFAVPMILGSLFQQVYNMADSVIVGRFVSQEALAAVGASSALTTVFICVAVGAGVGSSILVSRSFGAREYGKMKTRVSTAMWFFLGMSIVMGLIGFIFSRPIMSALNTPDDVMSMAVLYLKVYFAGFPFLFIYNVLASMFNAVGKSRVPLYLLIFSSLLNIVLDLWMVISLDLGVFGAALATLIAQGISAVLSLFLFIREMRKYGDGFSWFDSKELLAMLRLAIPSIIQQATISIGMMLVQSVVNSFGTDALAGYTATSRVESIFSMIFVSIGNAVSPFVSQNYGAGKLKRIREGYKAGLVLDAMGAALAFTVIMLCNRQIAGLFLTDKGTDMAYYVSIGYMKWIGYFYIFMGIKMATDGVLRGMGYMNVFMVANLVNLTVRVLGAWLLAPRYGVAFVWLPVPLGWLVNFLISYAEYRRKKIYKIGG